MKPTVSGIDHIVLTVADIDTTLAFYQGVLGMGAQEFRPADGSIRWALKFGNQKINLHQRGAEFDPKARDARVGSADICFLSDVSLDTWQQHLKTCDVTIEEGPVTRTGATGPLRSIYLRDPDGNLIEISNLGVAR